jgi:hypothetical protein
LVDRYRNLGHRVLLLSTPEERRVSPIHTLGEIMGKGSYIYVPTRKANTFLVVGVLLFAGVLKGGYYLVEEDGARVAAEQKTKAEKAARIAAMWEEARRTPSAMADSASMPKPHPCNDLPFPDSAQCHRDRADEGNRKVDQAMEDMLHRYREKAVSTETSSHAGVRVDTFVMTNGTIVICSTTVRNNARATSCN